jgi:hypothetical protein
MNPPDSSSSGCPLHFKDGSLIASNAGMLQEEIRFVRSVLAPGVAPIGLIASKSAGLGCQELGSLKIGP